MGWLNDEVCGAFRPVGACLNGGWSLMEARLNEVLGVAWVNKDCADVWLVEGWLNDGLVER